MRLVVTVALLQLVWACGTAGAGATSRQPRSSTPGRTTDPGSEKQSVPSSMDADAPQRADNPAGVALQRTDTEPGTPDAPPRLVVHNDYVTRQYVLLGERLLGSVAPGEQASFEIPSGAQRITFSDAPSGELNPKMLAEVFDAGFSYHYAVLAY